ncbi:MAG TPA: DUF4921 family protein [Gammaproteobacteria bacterium]|nr:DUF4921 family protein [Gammaproteobacteria bacterium]
MPDKNESLREIRINPIVPSESVLVATARNMRPRKQEDPAPRDTRKHVEQCPFCKGNEDETPPTINAWPDDENWEIRIVENLYPILGEDQQSDGLTFGLQQAIEGYGRHEVVIDHGEHGIALQDMTPVHIQQMFITYQERMQILYDSDKRIHYVLAFKNFGPAAGASIAHTHSQIIAMPVIPENVYNEVQNSREYYNKHHRCVFCSLIDEALTYEATIYDRDSGQVQRKINVGQYVIERSEHFIAIKPFASRYEWEIHIMPLDHQADFLEASTDHLADFAGLLKRTMQRLDTVIGGAQYNYFIHAIPHGEDYEDSHSSYHWHLEICPRTSIPNGFELGSGLFVNTVSPEVAAEKLRAVKLDEASGTA